MVTYAQGRRTLDLIIIIFLGTVNFNNEYMYSIHVRAEILWLSCSQNKKYINLALSVPDEGYSSNAPCALN